MASWRGWLRINMLITVVTEELNRHFLGQHEVAPHVWVWGTNVERDLWEDSRPGQLVLSVSQCPGGAYSHFGRIVVDDFEAVLWVKTVWGIMARRSERTEHHFEYCDPAFPENLVDFVKRAARNANRCYELAFQRGWSRYERRVY